MGVRQLEERRVVCQSGVDVKEGGLLGGDAVRLDVQGVSLGQRRMRSESGLRCLYE